MVGPWTQFPCSSWLIGLVLSDSTRVSGTSSCPSSLRGLSAGDISVGVVCDFLAFHAVTYKRAYRTLSGYRSALRHPLLLAFRIDINCVASDLFLRGVFN